MRSSRGWLRPFTILHQAECSGVLSLGWHVIRVRTRSRRTCRILVSSQSVATMANSLIQVGPCARQHFNECQPATLTRNLHRRFLQPPTGIDIGPEYKLPFNGFKCPCSEDLAAGRSLF